MAHCCGIKCGRNKTIRSMQLNYFLNARLKHNNLMSLRGLIGSKITVYASAAVNSEVTEVSECRP